MYRGLVCGFWGIFGGEKKIGSKVTFNLCSPTTVKVRYQGINKRLLCTRSSSDCLQIGKKMSQVRTSNNPSVRSQDGVSWSPRSQNWNSPCHRQNIRNTLLKVHKQFTSLNGRVFRDSWVIPPPARRYTLFSPITILFNDPRFECTCRAKPCFSGFYWAPRLTGFSHSRIVRIELAMLRETISLRINTTLTFEWFSVFQLTIRNERPL